MHVLGVEVMEINVPIVIGSMPPKHVRSRASITEHFYQDPPPKHSGRQQMPADRVFSEDSLPSSSLPTTVMFLQNRKERPIQLAVLNESYLCEKSEVILMHITRYCDSNN